MALNNVRVSYNDKGRVIISFDPAVKGKPSQKGTSDILATAPWHELSELDDSLAGVKFNLVVVRAKPKASAKKPAAKDDDAGDFDDMTLVELKKAARAAGLDVTEIVLGAPNEKLKMKRLRLALEEHAAEEPEKESEEGEGEDGEGGDDAYEAPTFKELRPRVLEALGDVTVKQAREVYLALCEDEYDWDTKPRQFKKDLQAKLEEMMDSGSDDEDEAGERETADAEDDEEAAPRKRTSKPAAKSGGKVRAADALKAKRAAAAKKTGRRG